jgi:hypothetical protein
MEWQVDIPNAFVGNQEKPSAKDLEAALGPSAAVWHQLVCLAQDRGVSDS